MLGPVPPEMIAAEARVAAVLGIEREDLEGWGEDRLSIVKEDVPESVEAFRELLHDDPSPQVLLIVISVLGGSYHTRLVHDFLRDVAEHVYVEWLAGRWDNAIRESANSVARSSSRTSTSGRTTCR